jgi:hypothetical protein
MRRMPPKPGRKLNTCVTGFRKADTSKDKTGSSQPWHWTITGIWSHESVLEPREVVKLYDHLIHPEIVVQIVRTDV